jgi:hypothetical protein
MNMMILCVAPLGGVRPESVEKMKQLQMMIANRIDFILK